MVRHGASPEVLNKSRLSHQVKISGSSICFDVVRLPEGESTITPVKTEQPPPPECEAECSAPVATVSLVDEPQVVSTPAQPSTSKTDGLVETETLVHSVFGLGLAEVEEPMDVVPSEVLLESLKPEKLPLSTDVVGEAMLRKGFWSPKAGRSPSVHESPLPEAPKPQRLRAEVVKEPPDPQGVAGALRTLQEAGYEVPVNHLMQDLVDTHAVHALKEKPISFRLISWRSQLESSILPSPH